MTALRATIVLALFLLAIPAGAGAQDRALSADARRLVEAAVARTSETVVYDSAYRRIAFPGGDVPADRGVCSDLVIRAYRAAFGLDLQLLVHRDMVQAFGAYPRHWGLKRPDSNIDHRRVPNLETFLTRRDAALPVTRDAKNYQPGDLVTWRLGGRLPHIGIVTDRRSADGQRPLVAHNIGAGPQLEDMLFDHPISGHFRYLDAAQTGSRDPG